MSQPFDFDEFIRRWQLGHLNSEELPNIAYLALEAGLECPSLYELAGLERPSMKEAGPILQRVLEELGRFAGTVAEQPFYFAVDLAKRILDRQVDLIDGCRQMFRIRSAGNLYDCKDLFPFVGVESETDTLPIGSVRERWAVDALKETDREIARLEAFYANSSTTLVAS